MNTTNIDQYLDSITNQDQLLLIQNVVNCFKDPREEIKQVGEQLMKQLEQRVKQQNQNQNQNAYEEQKESLKEPILYKKKKMGVSILSLDGSFILTDKETTQMLEWQFNKNKQKRLQDSCADAGRTNLYKQIKSEDQLLATDENEKTIKMTIYSELMRKKGMRWLSTKWSEKIPIDRIKESLKEIQGFNKYDKMRFKFLKTLSIELIRGRIYKKRLDKKSDNQDILTRPQLEYISRKSADLDDFLICKITNDDTVEQIDESDMANDKILAIKEIKWQEKVNSFKENKNKIEKQLEKIEKQQDKFEEQQEKIEKPQKKIKKLYKKIMQQSENKVSHTIDFQLFSESFQHEYNSYAQNALADKHLLI
ncbi:unnamed protein product (macronuclear) [Paramecium tetraurelia]|uniref:Uncharacterized protein n=1 Tax=Paramecium tetraurelia TaxID=5888 RepID=A0BD94_PARTE|nr:uncharacterized protein GSPATT00004605001 [Paramecium tetraurelia]CAK56511.1 unnamed protein product [Paramecium tetraurelia]|eukprot:XP_001423909.1 hypothetical protein (macronuclear) [Paramecium tetraurelia strain d4-2]